MHSTVEMCFAATNILLNPRSCVKMADHFDELSESDLNMKTKLVIE